MRLPITLSLLIIHGFGIQESIARKMQFVKSSSGMSHRIEQEASIVRPMEESKRKMEVVEDEGDITNDSEEVVDVLAINPFKLTLKPTEEKLSNAQISTLVDNMETIAMENLITEGPEYALIGGIDLNDDAFAIFVSSQGRVRKGRNLLVDSAHTDLIVTGGTANVTFSTEYYAPSEEDLNAAIVKILSEHLLSRFKADGGLINVDEVEVSAYDGPIVFERDEDVGREGIPVAASASIGVLLAIIFAVAVSFYAYKSGASKRIGQKYRNVQSSLRLKSLKRADSDPQAQEYLVEVCTDLSESPKASKMDTTNVTEENTSFMHTIESPSTVRSKKLQARERKTIDPADYIVEVATD